MLVVLVVLVVLCPLWLRSLCVACVQSLCRGSVVVGLCCVRCWNVVMICQWIQILMKKVLKKKENGVVHLIKCKDVVKKVIILICSILVIVK